MPVMERDCKRGIQIMEKFMETKIDLTGEWKFAFYQEWKSGEEFHDTIILPSTTEIGKKGAYAPDREETLHLSRRYPFAGKACYGRKIMIPDKWTGMYISLYLERTKYTEVYIDGEKVSSSHETLIPQIHDLTNVMTPGEHFLTIVVDNDLVGKPDFPESLMAGHQYTDHTQTNWNGILGQMYLLCCPVQGLKSIQTFGDCKRRGILIQAEIGNDMGRQKTLRMTVDGVRSDGVICPTREIEAEIIENRLEAFYSLEKLSIQWDEFTPVFYNLSVRIKMVEGEVIYPVRAYLQKKAANKNQFVINDRAVSLRGTVDCCIFPDTGACPMEIEEWLKICELIKSYGMNHYRFHSWCPPEAAFEAGDRLGVYFQVELPNFANGFYREGHPECDRVLNHYLWEQSEKIVKQFGNHPSFLIFAVGNEMVGELEAYEELISHLRSVRADKYYCQGSNNFLEHPIFCPGDDCFITMRTDEKTNVRASYSYADLPLGYLQTDQQPSTLQDYASGVKMSPVPLIVHEAGQYQTYPDYGTMEKYQGVLAPENLRIFQRRLQDAKMEEQAETFFRSSGMLSVQCYREEIEGILRTEGIGGFQLLGLQDFPGQGTALVGILDSFLESKELITPEKWRQFCAPQILMAQFKKYIWTEGETLTVQILVYNFGAEDLAGELECSLEDSAGNVLERIRLGNCKAGCGKLSTVGIVKVKMPCIRRAEQFTLILKMGSFMNEYAIWCYPDYSKKSLKADETVMVSELFGKREQEALRAGQKVVLFLGNALQSVEGSFAPDFWCYPMFREACEKKGYPTAPGTLGMVCDKNHPALAGFPTQDYAQWQWHRLLHHSRPVILDKWADQLHPIVQIIDNFERNHKLGWLFEIQTGVGKLLVCACNVPEYIDEPEMRCFYESVMAYARSEDMRPSVRMEIDEIAKVLV